VADLALVLELLESTDRILVRDVRIGGMQLVQVDAVELQAPKAALAALPQPLGARVSRPLAGSGPAQAALRRDHEAVRIGMQRLGDQVLAHLWAVRVGGVDQIDSQLDDSPEQTLGLLRVVWRAPDALPCDPHGAKAEAMNLEVTPDGERVHVD
jgi:hypothetical protein